MTRHLHAVNASKLDPVAIEELATIMADEKLVDMRCVPGGIAERVKVTGILIRRNEDQVELQQVIPDLFMVGEFTTVEHWVDAESIWWVKPTTFGPHDEVKVFDPKQPTVKLQSMDGAYDAAVKTVAFYHRITPVECDAAAKAGLERNHLRYWIMLLWEELTQQGAREATKLFGYHSIQPFVSARDLARREDDKYKKLRDALRLRQAP